MCQMQVCLLHCTFSTWEEDAALPIAAALCAFLSASLPGMSIALGSSEEKGRLSSGSKEKLSYFS